MIDISKEQADIIRAEGEKSYPNECCGIIYGNYVGGRKTAAGTSPIVNSSRSEEQYHRFLITPEDMMKAELKARELKQDILGFYHSHPDCPAEPSEYDREHALPFYSYVIVSVMKGRAETMTSWNLSEDREVFDTEIVNITETKGE